MFASFSGMINQGTGILFLVVMAWFILARKYLKDNPEVKDAGKKAMASKLISLIGKHLK